MRTDEQIKEDIVDQFYLDDRIDASKVTIEVDNGNVYLDGEVPTYRAKKAASEDVWKVSGVATVINNIHIKPPTVTGLTDEKIKQRVESALTSDPDLSSYKIDVSVLDGQVTLTGAVDAYWKKLEAEEIAFRVQGTTEVINKLAIVPTQKENDETLARRVVDAISRNANVNIDDINVEVRNSNVRLGGTVLSHPAKLAAYTSALYTKGVASVEDNIKVVPQL